MSLPYFKEFGWEAEIVTCYTHYYECNIDQLLLESLPKDLKIHYVKALDKKWTSKIGLGSLALRSLWYFRQKVNQILKNQKFDLVYFSTTEFPICILGAYWKKKFGIPYVIDMQDPWHSDYYRNKPKHERPTKYWFSYRLNKYLEPIAIKHVDGLIAVSQAYIVTLKERYPEIVSIPSKVITFGYSEIDYQIAGTLTTDLARTINKPSLRYIGVLGIMMNKSLDLLFKNLTGKIRQEYQLVFKGTSYAPREKAKKTTDLFVTKYKISNLEEHTERLGMFEVYKEMSMAAGLLIIGTDEASYTASKIYPYLQSGKPILAILHPESNANTILKLTSNAVIINLGDHDDLVQQKLNVFVKMIEDDTYSVFEDKLKEYSAKEMTNKQCNLFNKVLLEFSSQAPITWLF